MIRCEAERSGDGSDSGSAAIRESARLHLRVDVRVHLDVSPRLEALVARLLAALGRPGAEVADSGAVSAPRMVETAGAAVRDAPSPIDTERPEPVIPAAPAEPSPDLVPSAGAKHAGKRGGFNTPARDAIIAEGWPRGDPAWVMLDTINALPGRPFRQWSG